MKNIKKLLINSLLTGMTFYTTSVFAQSTANGTTYYGTSSGIYGVNNSNFGYASGAKGGGRENCSIGNASGYSINGGNYNTNVGSHSGYTNVTGSYNVSVGYLSGYSLQLGVQNVFVGSESGYKTYNASDNTLVGWHSGYNLTNGRNTAIGSAAGANIIYGFDNVFFGINAFGGTGIVADRNVVIGSQAFYKVSSKSGFSPGNIIIGYAAGQQYQMDGEKSIFLINNQANMNNPAIFGYLADNSHPADPSASPTSQARLGINTSNLKDGFNLTINGPTFIGNFGTNGINNTKVASGRFNDYSLYVEKGVLSEDFAIAPTASWADYVFKNDYKLMSLSNLDKYLKTYNHLPGIASAAEVGKDGYSLQRMNVKFLEKVEELTLYQIQADKEIKEQQTEIADLKSQLDAFKELAKEVQQLKAAVSHSSN